MSSETQTNPTAASAASPTSPQIPADEPEETAAQPPAPELRPLPTPIRIGLYFLGWFLLLVGLLGLALPGIQGILTMALGAALLSLASEAAHRRLRSLLRRWPAAQRLMERFRARVHKILARKSSK